MIRGLLIGACVVGAIIIGIAIVGRVLDFVDLTFFGILMVVGFITIWVLALVDIWRRADLGTAARLIWSGAIIVFPIVATLVYALARPAGGQVLYRGEEIA